MTPSIVGGGSGGAGDKGVVTMVGGVGRLGVVVVLNPIIETDCA